ncbi:hypothetical protein CLV24_12851 [Pontibacter ummariensis]|uniref:Uncharacterized protein n=1 Tax=Pontibacter ummariensis TaxID=1610492 RepID=A0A239KB35_9BACT|nr:hypothetical protein [Pontibacter ummariensis]PRY06069.1 hypothetical protein CLV24_12851 [Pontibacter ummariensis]SNT14859.1 hypothetical protein SAMN06296052_12751 [Pontibacter ummariensis]
MRQQQIPAPILFHPLKHHLGYIRLFLQESELLSELELKIALRTIGGSQLDLYTGPLSSQQLSLEVIAYLQQGGLLHPDAFRNYLAPSGYGLCSLSDGSGWTLRWGLHEGRHVHLHPARYSRHTQRVKANHLKTAIAAAIATTRFQRSMDLPLLNQVRDRWLALPPVEGYTAEEGLGKVLALLL